MPKIECNLETYLEDNILSDYDQEDVDTAASVSQIKSSDAFNGGGGPFSKALKFVTVNEEGVVVAKIMCNGGQKVNEEDQDQIQ